MLYIIYGAKYVFSHIMPSLSYMNTIEVRFNHKTAFTFDGMGILYVHVFHVMPSVIT